ncbi:PP2C family serine/threonine-protein phosphatase [Nostoc sphaeroides]|uniref:Protein phosphatase 2C domain-containing protein n=1 Tax=Nostoc sphaeroides CCNUC1 TaxID=2653204 RepID=A0A5P8W4W3_9NOSO|nr:PP2C family serine/threonine-protein phosphatase [Nostoc sphaeroides]MCC5631432.1 protein phosphatase 2C domain-containing protein [Nostoc sphaeroides CHAB 2801]QFS47690.1 protein phosphatase 2C domain-containing protein [Nostoc sphaeroides CCNUC1]
MNWKAVARSAIGTSHQKQGIGCQDYGDYRIFDDVIVGAVADGAGSAKHSDVGAKLAVETVLKCFSEINEFPQKQDSQPLSKEEAQKVFAEIVNKVITELQKQADEGDYAVNDLACTLLVFVANPDCIAAMQIGDGFIVMRSQESEYQLLFQPDKGEFINETTFITSTNALKEMQVKVITEKQEFISASTDGLEKVAIRLSDWQPFSPFFKPLEEYLHEPVNSEDEDKYLMEFLNSERLNSRTDDDKTLLLCLFDRE